MATFAELSYEDVFVAAAKIDPSHRGKSGASWTDVRRLAKALGFSTRLRRSFVLDEDEGLLNVRWVKGSPHYLPMGFQQHIVALAHGVVADPSDGLILPADEYLARVQAQPNGLLELT